MKLTKNKLKQLIKEELETFGSDSDTGLSPEGEEASGDKEKEKQLDVLLDDLQRWMKTHGVTLHSYGEQREWLVDLEDRLEDREAEAAGSIGF